MTPVKRLALLLGLMVADFAVVCGLCVPVMVLGFALGVRFETGLLGMLAFILLAGLWGLAFTGFPYAIALKTGSPARWRRASSCSSRSRSSPRRRCPGRRSPGWLDTVAGYNPVTYLLDGLRSLITDGWEVRRAAQGAASPSSPSASLSMSLCFAALRGRLKRG